MPDRPSMDQVAAHLDKVPEVLRAPFTAEQVGSLNEFQEVQPMHPFTHYDEVGESCGSLLVAEEDGWHCPDHPEYLQDWAWPWMADGSWRKMWTFAQELTKED